jgi:hypothetical protein
MSSIQQIIHIILSGLSRVLMHLNIFKVIVQRFNYVLN